ncbi:MAG TPA: hypothetical protein VK447_20705 [Myxococcaceae bacterium]|nr:hypothetical protein [Myxococcaceae bacterium]
MALVLAVLLATGCKQEPPRPAIGSGEPRPAVVTPPAPPAGAAQLDVARRALVLALKKAVLHPDRIVAHLSHVCSLEIEGKRYPIIDLQELVPSETTPRGVNAIVVLDSNLSLVQRIEYTTERPLFCKGNLLYVKGILRVFGLSTEGNELTFDQEAHVTSLQEVEAKDLPAWSPTSDAAH